MNIAAFTHCRAITHARNGRIWRKHNAAPLLNMHDLPILPTNYHLWHITRINASMYSTYCWKHMPLCCRYIMLLRSTASKLAKPSAAARVMRRGSKSNKAQSTCKNLTPFHARTPRLYKRHFTYDEISIDAGISPKQAILNIDFMRGAHKRRISFMHTSAKFYMPLCTVHCIAVLVILPSPHTPTRLSFKIFLKTWIHERR